MKARMTNVKPIKLKYNSKPNQIRLKLIAGPSKIKTTEWDKLTDMQKEQYEIMDSESIPYLKGEKK